MTLIYVCVFKWEKRKGDRVQNGKGTILKRQRMGGELEGEGSGREAAQAHQGN